ncbi:MAG: hypothetical protein COT74_02365 [Bdellovibrionales bacterium CG10_big_fil_rev_8_21_14_0_10_45_34]|nr:MAG: hypothetical protein COT74_02365 [Bdellovibrionales bacterium CG10_big_fil_rev_8_21_14_0_10_45_34]
MLLMTPPTFAQDIYAPSIARYVSETNLEPRESALLIDKFQQLNAKIPFIKWQQPGLPPSFLKSQRSDSAEVAVKISKRNRVCLFFVEHGSHCWIQMELNNLHSLAKTFSRMGWVGRTLPHKNGSYLEQIGNHNMVAVNWNTAPAEEVSLATLRFAEGSTQYDWRFLARARLHSTEGDKALYEVIDWNELSLQIIATHSLFVLTENGVIENPQSFHATEKSSPPWWSFLGPLSLLLLLL